MTNKEKILNLVSEYDTETFEHIKFNNANREWLEESQRMAIKVLQKLRELGWSQKDLAEKMGVTPQQVNKIVKGSENLTLNTIVKLQEILDIPLTASHYEKSLSIIIEGISDVIASFSKKPQTYTFAAQSVSVKVVQSDLEYSNFKMSA